MHGSALGCFYLTEYPNYFQFTVRIKCRRKPTPIQKKGELFQGIVSDRYPDDIGIVSASVILLRQSNTKKVPWQFVSNVI